ncbi:voltage-gated potassium channel [Cohaesibacter marisflavi]|uniref:Voltage-gated potassium channel n=1 Tax=Cohaesibacter marisflavi TaxID=655353 RepID=A0A1I4ZP14_9HYPH|nr:ion transporter [Cohaesibacter marisflavi]SFN51719.1 voltage-gated potassium channel [Cohaesibacter marisflavi]
MTEHWAGRNLLPFALSRRKVHAILNGIDPIWGRPFELVWAALILLSAFFLALETEPKLSETMRSILALEEATIVSLFSTEYILRIWSAPKRWQYIFSFWGVVDLLAILPFYLSLGIDLRGLRAIRLLRLFRILKLVRFVDAVERLRMAFADIKHELLVFAFMSLIVLYLAAVGIYYFENEAQPGKFSSVFQSLWWAVATLTTVGYGDVFPITTGGKVFTLFVLLIGIGIISVPSGLIASSLTNAHKRKSEKKLEQD